MRRVCVGLLVLVLGGSILAGCAVVGPAVAPRNGGGSDMAGSFDLGGETRAPVPDAPEPSAPGTPYRPAWAVPVTDENFASLVSRHHPNELGRVLILEYHDFKDVEERWARRWDNFRKDLETLYAKGYRAVRLTDYLAGAMPLPAGTSPVIFTFDDSLLSQLKLTKQDGQWVADPQSAVGIMLQFKKEHPDFGAAGTFYVNFTPVPFREEENWREKVRFLADNGFDLGNHSLWHDDLSALSDEEVQKTLAQQVAGLREVLPDYDGSTLALPFGLPPQNKALAVRGEFSGVAYRHRAVLLVGSDPVHSPYDKRVDFMELPRVQAIDSEFDRWFPYLDQYRYISDGDPDTVVIPDDMQEYLNPAAVQGKQVRTYSAGS